MKTVLAAFSFIPVFLLFNSCNNSTEPDTMLISLHEIPVINGIILTTFDGPDETGRWRNPKFPAGIRYFNQFPRSNIPIDLDLENPFPNPTTDAIVIQFSLPVAAEVSLWIVKGRLPEENPDEMKTGSGGVFVSVPDKISAVIFEKISLTAGYYMEIFNGRIGEEYLPTGFYRIYLEADNHLLWKDILVARSKADLPPELRDKYFNVGKVSE